MSVTRKSSFNGPGRRSSIIGNRKHRGKVDFRKDKDQNIDIMIDFLKDREFPDEVSNKTLKSPPTKYVKNIFLFLFNLLGQDFIQFEKFEQDVKDKLAFYGYPYSFSKSYLQAPGTLNSWPCVLASIVWLTKLIENIEENEEIVDELNTNLNDRREKVKDYLGGKNYEDIQKESMEKRKKELDLILKEKDEKKEKLEIKKEEVNQIKKGPRAKDKEAEVEKLDGDFKRFEELEAKMNEHLKFELQKSSQTDEVAISLDKKIKEMVIQTEFVKERCKTQKISREEIEKMKEVYREHLKEFKLIKERVEDLDKRVSTADQKRKKHQFRLDSVAKRLNSALRKIRVVPKTAKFAYKNDFELKIPHSQSLIGEKNDPNNRRMGSVDLSTLKSHVKMITVMTKKEEDALSKESTRLQTISQGLCEKSSQLEADLDEFQKELDGLRIFTVSTKEVYSQVRDKVKKELFKVKNDNLSINPSENDCPFELTKQLNEANERQKEVILNCKRDSEEMKGRLMAAMDKFIQYHGKRVEEFKQLETLTDKVEMTFPKID